MTRRHVFVRAPLGAAVALTLWGCAGPGASTDETPEGVEGAASEEIAPTNVTVQKLEPTSLREEVSLAGRLVPWVEVDVSTELGGTVQQIGFEKGQRVRRGRILARIGTDLLEAGLAEAEAELAAAEAEFNKTTELFERQAVPRQDLISATSRFRGAEARVAQARLRVERSILEAPISGVAISREIEPGEVVPPGALVTTLHQVSKLKAELGIPEDDISFFRVGGEATLEIDAYPDRDFEGEIHFLGPAATEQNRSFPAEIAIDNSEGRLRPGMIVRVHLVKRVFEDAIVVPRDAVLERDTGNVAFVMKEERAEMRSLETGPSESGFIVVLEGLVAGEELIVSGHRNLVDGQPVRAVSEDAVVRSR